MTSLIKLKKRIENYKKANIYKKALGLSKQETLTSFRVCIEIVAAVVVGLLIGSGLDKLAGTKILFKIVCLVLGCLASFRVVYKLALYTERRKPDSTID